MTTIIGEENLLQYLQGVQSIKNEAGFFSFFRFNDKMSKIYEKIGERSYERCFATAGVLMEMETDASNIAFDYRIRFIVRRYAYIDVLCDGELIAHEGRHFENETEEGFSGRLSVALPEGRHLVSVYLPNNSVCELSSPELSDAEVILAPQKKGVLYFLGDSITQGYDCEYPSKSYGNALSRRFGLCALNNAIGGELFRPETVERIEGLSPVAVVVAYGTNDWSRAESREELVEKELCVLRKVKSAYPTSRVVCISPIWRTELPEGSPCGDFFETARALFEGAKKEEGVFAVDGQTLVPHSPEFFWDARVHPNTEGSICYGENLIKQVEALFGDD